MRGTWGSDRHAQDAFRRANSAPSGEVTLRIALAGILVHSGIWRCYSTYEYSVVFKISLVITDSSTGKVCSSKYIVLMDLPILSPSDLESLVVA